MRILPVALPHASSGRPRPVPARPHLRDYGIAVVVVTAAADALFFDTLGRAVGLSAPLFVAMLAVAAAICHRHLLGRRLMLPAVCLAFAMLALVENVDWKSLTMAIAGVSCFSLAAAGRLPAGRNVPLALGRFLAVMPVAFPRDIRRLLARHAAGSPGSVQRWLIWLMPLALTLVFGLLLEAGNPVLERWIALIDPMLVLQRVDPLRILFWTLVAGLAWPFLRPRLGPGQPARTDAAPRFDAAAAAIGVLPGWTSLVYGPAAVLRALVLFNAVFAVQTLLDTAYLWGGLELPEGISYAAYAHRGAYTLIATALLAAAFVLLALRPGAAAAADHRIRGLVYLWIGQNVALVLSAMLRLDLYVDIYALTHWRLAAFVWMGIVAAGLVLICVRIACGRSNRWLVGANTAVLAVVFAGSCFLDADALIARFNVAHSRELSGQGVRLDVGHLASLGPAAIPAIDDFLAEAGTRDSARPAAGTPVIPRLRALRASLAEILRIRSDDWRNWTFRNWQLSDYLESATEPGLPTGSAIQPVDANNCDVASCS